MAHKQSWSRTMKLSFVIISVVMLNNGASEASESKNSVNSTDVIDDAIKKIGPKLLSFVGSYSNTTDSSSARLYSNGTFNTGYRLWDGILNECTKTPGFSCLQKNVYDYLNSSLNNNGDVRLADGICFKKNRVDLNKYSREANIIYVSGSNDEDVENEIEETRSDSKVEDQWLKASPLEEVTDALYDQSVNFMMTHDLSFKLPDTMFDGSTLKISPRALTKTGALVHMELQPATEDNGDGRIFFKKIKKYFRKKLVMAALSVFLLVVLIKLKVFFLLPLLLGVGAAKKFLIKILLFMFPSMSNVFKLCGWYHQHYQLPKYHHHHHLVAHHHHKVPVPVVLPHQPQHHHSSHPPVYGPPPPSHHPYSPPAHHHPPPPVYGPPHHITAHHTDTSNEHYSQDWELSGPGLGSEYIGSGIHRNANKPQLDDINEINSWGLGLPPGSVAGPPGSDGESPGYPYEHPGLATSGNTYNEVRVRPGMKKEVAASGTSPNYGFLGRPVGPAGTPVRNMKNVKESNIHQAEKDALVRAAEIAQRAPPSPVRNELLRVTQLQLKEQNRVRMEQKLVEQQQKILATDDPDLQTADKLYGSLVEKVEKILASVGASDPGCRDRAVCSLYRNPGKHSPYSNLVSNELSKDSNELPPAAGSLQAIRFYKYVQAARDGQEQKDCVKLYPVCTIDFHKK